MLHLPKLAQENVLFDCKDIRNQNSQIVFDKSMKTYVLKITSTQNYTYQNLKELRIKGSQVYMQLYVMEKLKFILELTCNQQFYRIIVTPNCTQVYSKKPDEIRISSAFILTRKWISLCFDVESFFDVGECTLHMLSIHSSCKLRKIYECNHTNVISDGFCLVQKVSEKRILELIPSNLRAQSEKQEIRKVLSQRRQSTISSSQEKIKESERKSVRNPQTQQKLVHPPPSTTQKFSVKNVRQIRVKQKSQENLLEKTVKLATGLQVIEEIKQQKPPLYSKQSGRNIVQINLQKKAVQSFLRHTQEIQNVSQISNFQDEIKSENEQISEHNSSIKQLYYDGIDTNANNNNNHNNNNNNNTNLNEYQSKYGKFSSTFSKPFGFSSIHNKLVSQQSTNQQQNTLEYFYLSDQQLQMKESNRSNNQTANEIEEQIEVMDNAKSKISDDSFNSLNHQIKQEDSSEDLAISKFE